jgi:predicted alpha/beta hydrolase
MPSGMLGMGEDLPLGVYRDWRRWCSFPHYFFDDPAERGLADEYGRVRTPIVAANSLDDRWAPPRSRDAFLEKGYRNAPVERIDIDPRTLGDVGNVGYFRRGARPLWDGALDWFRRRPGESRTYAGMVQASRRA